MIHSSEMRQSTRVETVLPDSHTHGVEFTKYFSTKLQSLDAEISLQHNRTTNPSNRAYTEDFYWSLSSRYIVRRSVIGSYYNHWICVLLSGLGVSVSRVSLCKLAPSAGGCAAWAGERNLKRRLAAMWWKPDVEPQLSGNGRHRSRLLSNTSWMLCTRIICHNPH